jgi:hypothetical protein
MSSFCEAPQVVVQDWFNVQILDAQAVANAKGEKPSRTDFASASKRQGLPTSWKE